MRRILVVLAALLALANAPAFAVERAGAFRAETAICVCPPSDEDRAEHKPAATGIPEALALPVAKARSIAWAEIDTRFQRPPPAV